MSLFKKAVSGHHLRRPLVSVVGALSLFAVIATSAAASPSSGAKDWFTGTAVISPGQTTPVQVNPNDMTRESDGSIGLGYTYRASGQASGQLPGTFTYEEHGYLYFINPANPASMVGSRFSSGVFTLTTARRTSPVVIADTAPASYTSGIQTQVGKLGPQAGRVVGGQTSRPGPLTYGYFTFSDTDGTFTGYATPDFLQFAIQITFEAPK